MRKFKDGEKVVINQSAWREHGRIGTVRGFDVGPKWYWVEMELGPPWSGKYKESELVPLESGKEE